MSGKLTLEVPTCGSL
uniref:Uncharacterized protein n=1 Tax=Arundo donax TaxID=35708 RepID=A0A0A9BQB5_ARUDO